MEILNDRNQYCDVTAAGNSTNGPIGDLSKSHAHCASPCVR